MATKTLTIALALIMGSFTATFAGTPKDSKDASPEPKTETTAPDPVAPKIELKQDGSFTYYVVDSIGSYYNVSESDPGCSAGAHPCEVQSAQQKDNQNRILKSAVTDVITRKN
ncbi:MAG: hypothetical protein PW786_05070 [Arachidicoccus sp.]|nr:hypothetical protein [Arachidicoccus sp.]